MFPKVSRTSRAHSVGIVAMTTVALLAACGQGDAVPTSGSAGRSAQASTPLTRAAAPSAGVGTDKARLKTRVWTQDLDVPWGLAFLPEGGILVSGRDNAKVTLVRENGTKRLARKVNGVVPNGHSGGEAGLLGPGAFAALFARPLGLRLHQCREGQPDHSDEVQEPPPGRTAPRLQGDPDGRATPRPRDDKLIRVRIGSGPTRRSNAVVPTEAALTEMRCHTMGMDI